MLGHIHELTMCTAPTAVAALLFEYIIEEYTVHTLWTTTDQPHYIWLLSGIDFFLELRECFVVKKLNYSLDFRAAYLSSINFWNLRTSGLTFLSQ